MTADQCQVAVDAARRKILTMHRIMTTVMVAYLPLVVAVHALGLPQWFLILCAASLILSGIVLAFVIAYSRCPLCSQRYHVRGMSGNIFTGKCLHCGMNLKKPVIRRQPGCC